MDRLSDAGSIPARSIKRYTDAALSAEDLNCALFGNAIGIRDCIFSLDTDLHFQTKTCYFGIVSVE